MIIKHPRVNRWMFLDHCISLHGDNDYERFLRFRMFEVILIVCHVELIPIVFHVAFTFNAGLVNHNQIRGVYLFQ